MKRVITGVNDEGKSYVVSSEELEVELFIDVHNFTPDHVRSIIGDVEDGTTAEWLEPPAGGIKIMYIAHTPVSQMTGPPPDLPGLDEEGFHTTRTFDVDYVTHGELTMLLDTEKVVLRGGDVVIQQATRHAWRNESEEQAGLLAILHTPA
ncbi:MAG TPA: hypothetical protein VFG42_24285 [Baekduia sp.]|uniref:hypothetical protein n=1 Tax=Baekduia sp. TaxID=2600305 RepID=UPI002D79C849|nr:hypothetical protein [Baekduia sp.]HET6509934.1 hypothetical protein [Baekduia sp.]